MKFEPSSQPGKRFKVTFSDGTIRHFGAKNGTTFIDGATEQQKKNWIARHSVRENHNDPYTAGALSRHLLWNTRDFEKNHKVFMKHFNVS
jgi:hypothetical protein